MLKEQEKSRIPGEMGLRDVQIIAAIYESAKTEQENKVAILAGVEEEKAIEVETSMAFFLVL